MAELNPIPSSHEMAAIFSLLNPDPTFLYRRLVLGLGRERKVRQQFKQISKPTLLKDSELILEIFSLSY